jgi:hypothetical protein
MNQRKVKFLLSILILVYIMSACNAAAPTEGSQQFVRPLSSEETAFPPVTIIAEPTSSSQNYNVLQSEAEVPRIPVEQALAAVQSGAAVIVDVRSAQAYQSGHVKGAISIPLAEIETNIEGLTLEKDQWIITYCT